MGGTNCSRFAGGRCWSSTASGEPWQVGIGRPGTWSDPATCACPPEYEFGTRFVMPGGEVFRCNDRGGKIQTVAGIPWLDLMIESSPVPYGTILPVVVLPPEPPT